MLMAWLATSCLNCSDDTPVEADAQAAPPTDVVDDSGENPIEGSEVTVTEEREPCADRNPYRNVYFGDLHIHTSYSFDAWVFDVRTTPPDAYAFARGEAIPFLPLDELGQETTTVQLERPLDFAAVTDHSEFLAEIDACVNPESEHYDLPRCQSYREGGNVAIVEMSMQMAYDNPQRFEDLCGADGTECEENIIEVWGRMQEAAEATYDRTSACQFTSFVAYEYTGTPGVSNVHRNVIFRNENVPEMPTSYFEEPTAVGLWEALTRTCLDADIGCDVLAIPHNSNQSNGKLFIVEYPGADTLEDEQRLAALRRDMEPLVEIFQHKGASECLNGLSGIVGEPDELCNFELYRDDSEDDCYDETGWGGITGEGCISRYDFVRNVLLAGLGEEQRIGVNPYRLGIIASTDTHNAISGRVEEDDYDGHWGNREIEPTEEGRLGFGAITLGGVVNNPGGLAAVWAVENSRDAIFEAMQRRETFGTSGPRMTVRFFGGWDLPGDLCDQSDLVELGYQTGVPMGSDLPARPESSVAPTFVTLAMRDPGSDLREGTQLQRIQIIKGWIASDESHNYQVFDVAGDTDSDAAVDTETCETSGTGYDTLCATWTDPEFDPMLSAYYYVRVIENPTCRWSTYDCSSIAEADRPPSCSDPRVPETIQERAWTSPIWYVPQ